MKQVYKNSALKQEQFHMKYNGSAILTNIL